MFSQETAEIVFADGDLFSIITSEGSTQTFEPLYDDVLGETLHVGDTILTENNTWLELRLNNSGSLIKISENTTFKIESLTEGGGGALQVVYGRIRAKANKLANNQELWVTGYDTVAGIRGTDFGYELFFDPNQNDSERITTVYCFEGTVEVSQQKQDPGDVGENEKRIEMKEPVLLQVGELVNTINGFPDDPLIKETIPGSLSDYWQEHDFVADLVTVEYDESLWSDEVSVEEEISEEPDTTQESAEAEAEIEEETPLIIVEEEEYKMPENYELYLAEYELRNNVQTAAAITMSIGMGFATAGTISYMINPEKNRDMLEVFGGMGALFMVTGTGLSLYSITLDVPPDFSP